MARTSRSTKRPSQRKRAPQSARGGNGNRLGPDRRGRLHGKVCIVSGGATGIGEAVVRKFVGEGARVVVNGLPGDPVEEVATSLGTNAFPVVADVSTEAGAKRCVEAAVAKWGRVDVVVNNAGVYLVSAPLENYPIDDFDQTLRMNCRTAFLLTKHALPELQKRGGVLLFTGSEGGLIGQDGNAPYAGTKGWLHAFALSLATEQAPHGVRANCVCPGPIDTAWVHRETGAVGAGEEAGYPKMNPMGRLGTPEEVANVFAFLASDEASFVNGALWLVDGGDTVGKGLPGDEVPARKKAAPRGRLRLEHQFEGTRGKQVRVLP